MARTRKPANAVARKVRDSPHPVLHGGFKKSDADSCKHKRPTTSNAALSTSTRITRSMTTHAARMAVFDTPELLENIITFLPATEILTKILRVSKTWKAAVKASPRIKTKLWLRPQAAAPSSPDEYMSKAFVLSTTVIRRMVLKLNLPIYTKPLLFNPFPRAAYTKDERLVHVRVISISPPCHVVKVRFNWRWLSKVSAHPRRPSWLDMYLTESPITVAPVVVRLPLDPGSRTSSAKLVISATVRDRQGLTFAIVLDVMERMAASIPTFRDCKFDIFLLTNEVDGIDYP